MKRSPILGLNIRLVISLAVILGLFIVLTQVSVSELTRIAVFKQMATTGDGLPGADIERDFGGLRRLILFYLVVGAVAALVLAALVVRRQVIRPIRRVNSALENVASGRLDTKIPIEGARELADMGIAFNQMTATLREQQAALRRQLRDLESSSRELAGAQDRLIRTAKLASVGTLAAGVAHEIGNPLAGVLGLLETIEIEGSESPEIKKKYLNLMRREIERIDRTIRDLLAFARAPQPSEIPTAHPRTVMAHLRALLKAQPLFDRVDIIEKMPNIALKIPAGDLTQLLLNLFLNAAQAMAGEGRITLEGSVVKCALSEMGEAKDTFKICVSDTGPGIDAQDEGKIFDPFFSNRRAGSGTGTGLGLAICQSICDRAGGDITLDRDFEEGTRFIILLPTAAEGETTPQGDP